MRVLLVKLSSMGDVLHNLPVVSDLVRAYPGIQIDWVTEAPYAGLVALHPKVGRVFPMCLRALKKRWWSPAAWALFLEARGALRGNNYDVVLDTQGLIKSALVAHWANGPVAGFSRETAREPIVTTSYQQKFAVPRNLHAVERNRRLAAGILGYQVSEPLLYGIQPPALGLGSLPQDPYVVFLHATSRPDKMWPEANWVAIGRCFRDLGIGVVLPWGNDAEYRTSERIAKALPGAVVPGAMSLVEAATLLANARGAVGVDTGLAHLSVALERPTVGLYITTSPGLTGLYGSSQATNLGGGDAGRPVIPSVEEAWHACAQITGKAL
jgi:heptosyltransferase-1